MVNRLCKITLSVKDYQTQQKGSFTYNGEVISLESNLKHYYYRFYETDAGTLSVSIDFSKPKIIIVEQSEQVLMTLGLNLQQNERCIYQLDENHHLELTTKTWEIDIQENRVYLDYDLYDSSDVNLEHPISRNIVEIICEGEKI